MPVTSSRIESKDLTLFTVTGALGFHESITAIRVFYSGTPTANVLLDLRLIEGKRMTTRELTEVIAFIPQYTKRRPGGKTAFVAISDLDFGLSRMLALYAQCYNLPWEVRAFRSMGEATDWMENPAAIT